MHEVGIVAERKSCCRYMVQHRAGGLHCHHWCILIADSLQTKEDLQETSICYQRISDFLSCAWLPDVAWWRAELCSCFQNHLYPLLPETPSALLSYIATVNPDTQVLYTNASTWYSFFLPMSSRSYPPVLQILLFGLAEGLNSLKINACRQCWFLHWCVRDYKETALSKIKWLKLLA